MTENQAEADNVEADEAGTVNDAVADDSQGGADVAVERESNEILERLDAYERQKLAFEQGNLDAMAAGDVAEKEDEAEDAGDAANEIHDDQEPAAQEDGSEDDEDGPQSRNKPIRIRPKDEREQQLLEMRRRNPDMPLEAILEQIGILGNKETAENPKEPAQALPSLAELKAELAQLREEELNALDEFDTDRIKEARKREWQLQDAITEAQARESQEASAFDAAFYASEDRVTAEFPDATKPNSRFAERMREIDEAWQEARDSRYLQSDKPEIIARIVAKEMGLKPGTPAPANQKTAIAPTARRKTQAAVAPASGSARTAQSRTGISQEIAAIRQAPASQQIDRYEALKARLLG